MFKPNPYRWITPKNISDNQRRVRGIGIVLMLVIAALLATINQSNAQELCAPDLTAVQAEYDKVAAAEDVLVALRELRAGLAGYDSAWALTFELIAPAD